MKDKRDVRSWKINNAKTKKNRLLLLRFRGSTGGFCVLDFWPFSSFFSNKDVTSFFFETRKTKYTNGVTFFF